MNVRNVQSLQRKSVVLVAWFITVQEIARNLIGGSIRLCAVLMKKKASPAALRINKNKHHFNNSFENVPSMMHLKTIYFANFCFLRFLFHLFFQLC